MALVVLLATQAVAQAPAPGALTPPPDAPTVIDPPEPAPVPPTFFERMLSVDEKGRVYEGRQRKLLTRREVFERVDRPDLLARSDELARRRLGLGIAAGVLAVAAATTGILLIAFAPSYTAPGCEQDVTYYNEVCVPRHQAYETAGSAVLVAGGISAALLATFAYWSNPDVLSRDEVTALVGAYNAKLKRTLAPPVSWRVAPFVGPGTGGLTARLTW